MTSHPKPVRRLHAQMGVQSLDAHPIDGGGVREVRVFEARVEGELASEVWRPQLDDGSLPPRPSLALAVEPEFVAPEFVATDAQRAAGPAPAFEFDGTCVRAQVRFPTGTSFYGGGLVAAPLLRNGRAVVFWNTDAWAYGEESPALYSSHPYALALLPDGSAVGVLADSIRRGALLFAPEGLEFEFEQEPFDLHLLHGPHPRDVQRKLARLIGRCALPPLWALGYHQCRWSYMSEREVLEIARGFRSRRIPCDALWLDIDHMDRRRDFTWDPERFPSPRAMTSELERQGFHTVAILDPGLAADPSYAPSQDGLRAQHFVLDAQGRPVKGRVWPGVCHFPDFTRGETRDWWAGHVSSFVRDAGLHGAWIDMNEPSLFRTPTKTLPETAQHRGDGGGSHAKFHNVYGQRMSEATREGCARAGPDRRPFVLTRAGHLATARHAATWTGDNQATWQDLAWTIPMLASLGLCGQPFSGPDLGGFAGDPTPELFERWFELGAYLPFARGHSERTACRKEPWSFGSEVEARVRRALERRMRLLPYLYTLFEEAERSGIAPLRPLWWADPAAGELRALDDSFLLGEDLLVAPVLRAGQREREVLLPRQAGGGWYHFTDLGAHLGRHVGTLLAPGTVSAGAPLGETPLYARAGAIVPLGPTRMHAGERALDPLELHVFLDAGGSARGSLYEDGGDGPADRSDRGDHRRTSWTARWSAGALALESEAAGPRPPLERRRIVRLYGAPGSAHVHEFQDGDPASAVLRADLSEP
jgi:alpha-glucosidase